MTKMMLNGLLHCLLFILTSAAMLPQPNLTADLQMDKKESRVDIQARSNRKCEDRGGVCVPEKVECPAVLPDKDDTICSNNKKCCYQQPPRITREVCESETTCVWAYSTGECFCLMPFTDNTWSQASSTCNGNGWALPHPMDAVALRSAIVQLKGNCDSLWLNAKYNGTAMVWQPIGSIPAIQITTDNPLLADTALTSFTANTCLELLAAETYWSDDLNKPYGVKDCDSTENHDHTLCQRYN